jgi:hypothetical protein
LLCLGSASIISSNCSDEWIAIRTKQADLLEQLTDGDNDISQTINYYENICGCNNPSEYKDRACGKLYKAYMARADQLENELNQKIALAKKLNSGVENWGMVSAFGAGLTAAASSDNELWMGVGTDAAGILVSDAKQEKINALVENEIPGLKREIDALRNKANHLIN